MSLIEVRNPIVEIDGDEMTRVLWSLIKSKLILPNISADIRYFDLSIENRILTEDQVTFDAAEAIKQFGVGIKCATITAPELPSPNGTIRKIVGGTVFREPILCRNLPRYLPGWNDTIVIGRHAYGDQYQAEDFRVPAAGRLKIVFEPADGSPGFEKVVHDFPDSGVAMAMYNEVASIEAFARACGNFALNRRLPLYFSTKHTILKQYDTLFRDVFERVMQEEFADLFEEAGIFYQYRLIDDLVAIVTRGEGGLVWACKNYDGDIQSDFVAQGFGSLGMMSSTLLSPDGDVVETEAAHGTVSRHYALHQAGQETSTNPIASIFAWTSGLKYRGKFDSTPDLVRFAETLEEICISTIESGSMTKDLARGLYGDSVTRDNYLNTEEFMDLLATRLRERMQNF